MKKLPLNISDFKEIIDDNYLYIDKTKLIYKLITTDRFYFFSRPRRFGKSLLISTLKELFLGNKELFKDLWIYQSDYNWKQYSVIQLDFSTIPSNSPEEFKEGLLIYIDTTAKKHAVDIEKHATVEMRWWSLIENLSKKNKIVLLIDEYDQPLLKNINEPQIAQAILDIMRSFFLVTKATSAHFRAIFITGVTKFSKTSIFSGLNNLIDITLDPHYKELLGYTQNEIKTYFENAIAALAQKKLVPPLQLLEDLRLWYNGYQFSYEPLKVYNPFSILYFLRNGQFDNYWFETGTPSFLTQLIKKYNYPIQDFSGAELNSLEMSTFEIGDIPLLPLLLQTGYLTITNYNNLSQNYTLDYPNREVKISFLRYFLKQEALVPISSVTNYAIALTNSLKCNDLNAFFSILQQFFASIPYDMHIPQERYYQSIFYIIMQLLGSYIDVEVKTNIGRIDAVIKTDVHIYIFEFKIDTTGAIALQQIEDKQYYQKYLILKKPITLIGLSFDTKTKNIAPNWEIKDL